MAQVVVFLDMAGNCHKMSPEFSRNYLREKELDGQIVFPPVPCTRSQGKEHLSGTIRLLGSKKIVFSYTGGWLMHRELWQFINYTHVISVTAQGEEMTAEIREGSRRRQYVYRFSGAEEFVRALHELPTPEYVTVSFAIKKYTVISDQQEEG